MSIFNPGRDPAYPTLLQDVSVQYFQHTPQTVLMKIPSHVGIPGEAAADHLAKLAQSQCSNETYNMTIPDANIGMSFCTSDYSECRWLRCTRPWGDDPLRIALPG